MAETLQKNIIGLAVKKGLGKQGRSKMVDIESSEYQEKWSSDQGQML